MGMNAWAEKTILGDGEEHIFSVRLLVYIQLSNAVRTKLKHLTHVNSNIYIIIVSTYQERSAYTENYGLAVSEQVSFHEKF